MKNINKARITDNVNEWKQREFKRLFPNSLFSRFEQLDLHFYPYGHHNFDLRKFKKEYEKKMNDSAKEAIQENKKDNTVDRGRGK